MSDFKVYLVILPLNPRLKLQSFKLQFLPSEGYKLWLTNIKVPRNQKE